MSKSNSVAKKASKSRKYFIALSVTSALVAVKTPVYSQTQFPSDSKQNCVVSDKEFKGWKQIKLTDSSPLIGPFYDSDSGLTYIFPANGPAFDSSKDCAFYKWSAQMFLWLTSTVTDSATKPTSPSSPNENTNYVFSSEFFYDVKDDGNGNLRLAAQGTEKLLPPLKLRVNKPVDAESSAQAGSSGILMSQPENKVSKKSSLVHFGMQTNRLYGYFWDKFNAQTPTSKSPFPSTGTQVCDIINYALDNGLADKTDLSQLLADELCGGTPTPAEIAGALKALSKGNVIPQIETAIDYLSMAMELKTSWVESDTLKHPERHIQQIGDVPVYDISADGKTWTPTGKTQRKSLALTGMHVVGTLNGHPEFTWATIEHVDNAPSQAYYYETDKNNGKDAKLDETTEKANGNWLFSDGTFTKAVDATTHVVQPWDKPSKYPGKSVGTIVSTNGKAISDVNVNRLSPWGSAPDKSSAENNSMLISLNQSVRKWVAADQSNDPRANYFLSGAVWTSGGVIPTSPSDTAITGSSLLANTTMESYTQDSGCFGCHYITPNTAETGVSHIFGSIVGDFDMNAGPIFSNDEAQTICPKACTITWNGNWTTTTENGNSICAGENMISADKSFSIMDGKGGVSAGPIFSNDEAKTMCPAALKKVQWNGQWTTIAGGTSVCGCVGTALPWN